MLFMGPLSSSFDMIVFASIWFIFGIREAAVFQTIWFSYGVLSNLIGMHIIRTAKTPGVPILYCFVALFAKKIYIRKHGEWI